MFPQDVHWDTVKLSGLWGSVRFRASGRFAAAGHGGARHWAVTMTLIQTATLNRVDPMA
jgi:hypothetical protein